MADYGSLPFAEQIDSLRSKLELPTERWDDIRGAAHDRAFVVAGAQGAGLLADLHAAVLKGVEQGTTLEEFRADFDALVQRRGWTGWTGSGSEAGRAWRTRVIYDTNLRTSYAAGRWAQIQEVKADRPYLEYRHNDSVLFPRPLHASWDGLVLSADDPWWRTHYPPSGWGCKCRVFALAPEDLAELGKDGPDQAPDDGTYTLERRGATHTIPKGIDYGWDHAPGATWHPDPDRYPYEIARDMVAANLRDGVFERWHERIARQVDEELAKPEYAGVSRAETAKRLRKSLSRGEEYPAAVISPETSQLLGVQTQVVKLSDYDLIKQQQSRQGQDFEALRYLGAQSTLDQARLIVRENDQMTIFVSDAEGTWHAAVLQQTKSGRGLYLKSYRRSNEADARTQARKGEVLKNDL